jgi:hypothetical protein
MIGWGKEEEWVEKESNNRITYSSHLLQDYKMRWLRGMLLMKAYREIVITQMINFQTNGENFHLYKNLILYNNLNI